jgi:hypothetical protein
LEWYVPDESNDRKGYGVAILTASNVAGTITNCDALCGSGTAFSTQTTPCYSRSYKLIYALLTYKAAGLASFYTL